MKIKKTVVLSIAYFISLKFISAFQGSFTGSTAVSQLEDSAMSYSTANLVVGTDLNLIAHSIFVVILIMLWKSSVTNYIKKQSK